MIIANYDAMRLDELRQHVLKHREDISAFQKYVDRSKSSGRMISIVIVDGRKELPIEFSVYRLKAIRSSCSAFYDAIASCKNII